MRIGKFMFRKRYDLHKVDDINRKIVWVLRVLNKVIATYWVNCDSVTICNFFRENGEWDFCFSGLLGNHTRYKNNVWKGWKLYVCVCVCVVSVCVAAAGPSPCCYNRQKEENRRKKNKKKKKKKTKFNEPCLVYTYIHSMEEYDSVEKVQIYR